MTSDERIHQNAGNVYVDTTGKGDWMLVGAVTGDVALGFSLNIQPDPQSELLWRLNERLQGRDPGQPIHWKGPHK